MRGRLRSVGGRVVEFLLDHPVQRFFGESRMVTWSVIAIVVLFALVLVRPVAMSLLSYHRTAALLAERRAEVAELERRNESLREQREFHGTDAFIVEQARSYGMVRPGERSYVLRELEHPASAGRYALNRLRSVTVDHPLGWQPIT